ncbi:hypothetical protein JXI42_12090, partial [bacterium]|nr:hypothetical protein [bacterium]
MKNIFVFFLLATFIIITPTFSQPCIDCRIGILATPYFHDVVAEGYILLRTIDTMFCDFVVDTSIESMSYGSCNVYIIPTQYNRYLPESLDSFSLPDSVRLDLINWTYDGGKLVIMGENCLARGGGAVVTDLLHDSRWNTGMRYDSTRVVPEYPDPAYEEFAIHPILAGLPDTVWADRAGNVIVTPPAIRLVWTENPEYRAIHCYDTTIYRSNPTMIAMSHWGEGTVIYHTDLSNFDSYYNYYVSGITF